MTRTITITSGKGGVGKTSISVNVALHLATLGYRTCLFDADLGLANINILLGLNPEYDLEDVILKGHNLQDIIIKNYKGIDIIPGSSGVEKMANLGDDQMDCLIRSFSELDEYDFLIFDTSAGVSRNVISLCLASSEVVLIITPEPTSLTDAYALLKILSLNEFNGTVKIVVNQCKSIPIAKLAYNRFKEAVEKYLSIDVMPLGIVVQDQSLVEAVKTQQALILLHPGSNASRCIKNITKHLLENQTEDLQTSGMESFWTRCFQLIKSPLNLTGSQKTKKGIVPEPSIKPLQKRPLQLVQGTEQKSVPEESRDTGGPVQSLKKVATGESVRLQVLEKEAPTPKTGVPAESGSVANLEQDIPLLMSKLIDSISSASQELQLIRKTLEKGERNGLGMNGSVNEGQGALQSKPITLDFDAFLKQRGIDVTKKGDE